MKNPRMTPKDQALIRGGLRRAFSRSQSRKTALERSILPTHTDPSRPRVKTWCSCALCAVPTPKSYIQIDHKSPVIKLNETFEDLSLDKYTNRLWCRLSNLQALCLDCHKRKSKEEAKLRSQLRKKRA